MDRIYENWKREAEYQLIQKGYDLESAEICENGDVYFGNMSYATGLVVSFDDYQEAQQDDSITR